MNLTNSEIHMQESRSKVRLTHKLNHWDLDPEPWTSRSWIISGLQKVLNYHYELINSEHFLARWLPPSFREILERKTCMWISETHGSAWISPIPKFTCRNQVPRSEMFGDCYDMGARVGGSVTGKHVYCARLCVLQSLIDVTHPLTL